MPLNILANTLPIITNVRKMADEDELIIIYDLEDKETDKVDIVLRTPNGLNYDKSAYGVSGDIGANISCGTNKEIHIYLSLLEVTGEINKISIEEFVPQLLAYDGYGYGGEMILIPLGENYAYYMDKFEITNEQFAEFINSDGYELREYWIIDDGSISVEDLGWQYNGKNKWQCPKFWDLSNIPYWQNDIYSNKLNTPVVGITWFEAYAYSKWAGRSLPLHKEYQNAIGLKQTYPWGENLYYNQTPPVYNLFNGRLDFDNFTNEEGYTTDGFIYTSPVGSFSPMGNSDYEICDLLGNAREWCLDAATPVEYFSMVCSKRYLFGGSWRTPLKGEPILEKCPLYRTDNGGFRCVLEGEN